MTLVTTLLDPERYPKKAVAELYGLRWQVETNLRHLKTTMKMDVLRCQTADGIFRELSVFGIVYNAVRLMMIHAGEAQGGAAGPYQLHRRSPLARTRIPGPRSAGVHRESCTLPFPCPPMHATPAQAPLLHDTTSKTTT